MILYLRLAIRLKSFLVSKTMDLAVYIICLHISPPWEYSLATDNT